MNLETFWVHYGLGSGSYRTTAGGMIGCFTISSNPLKNFFIRVDRRPRRYFIPAESVKSRLSKNLPCSVDGFHPFFLVLKGRKRIHSQRRFGKGIFTSNFYWTTWIGKHWSDIDLIPMSSSWRGLIVTDRQRQKMKHQVWVRLLIITSRKTSCFKMIGGRRALSKEKPLKTDPRFIPPTKCWLYRNRWGPMHTAHTPPNGPVGFLTLPEVHELFWHLGAQDHLVPAPEKCNSWGELKAPPQLMISPPWTVTFCPLQLIPTPSALFPSKRMHNAWARQIIWGWIDSSQDEDKL